MVSSEGMLLSTTKKKRRVKLPWVFDRYVGATGWIFSREAQRGLVVRRVVALLDYHDVPVACRERVPFYCSTWFIPHGVLAHQWHERGYPEFVFDRLSDFGASEVAEAEDWLAKDPRVIHGPCSGRSFMAALPEKHPRQIRGFTLGDELEGHAFEQEYYRTCAPYGVKAPFGWQRSVP